MGGRGAWWANAGRVALMGELTADFWGSRLVRKGLLRIYGPLFVPSSKLSNTTIRQGLPLWQGFSRWSWWRSRNSTGSRSGTARAPVPYQASTKRLPTPLTECSTALPRYITNDACLPWNSLSDADVLWSPKREVHFEWCASLRGACYAVALLETLTNWAGRWSAPEAAEKPWRVGCLRS